MCKITFWDSIKKTHTHTKLNDSIFYLSMFTEEDDTTLNNEDRKEF